MGKAVLHQPLPLLAVTLVQAQPSEGKTKHSQTNKPSPSADNFCFRRHAPEELYCQANSKPVEVGVCFLLIFILWHIITTVCYCCYEPLGNKTGKCGAESQEATTLLNREADANGTRRSPAARPRAGRSMAGSCPSTSSSSVQAWAVLLLQAVLHLLLSTAKSWNVTLPILARAGSCTPIGWGAGIMRGESFQESCGGKGKFKKNNIIPKNSLVVLISWMLYSQWLSLALVPGCVFAQVAHGWQDWWCWGRTSSPAQALVKWVHT